METSQPYCTACVARDNGSTGNDDRRFDTFSSLLAFLNATYESFANVVAEQRANDPATGQYPLGGFGIDLTNRWSQQVMVGVGRDVWAFWALNPTTFYTDSPLNADGLVFFVDGWHYTECDKDWLVSRETCHRWLLEWLENNQLPPT